MVVIEKEGNILDSITVSLGSKIVSLSEKTDSKLLYNVVEELGRILLNIDKDNPDLNQSLTLIYNKVDKLSSVEAEIVLAKLELISDSLRSKLKR